LVIMTFNSRGPIGPVTRPRRSLIWPLRTGLSFFRWANSSVSLNAHHCKEQLKKFLLHTCVRSNFNSCH
jgi:hypothetical protein